MTTAIPTVAPPVCRVPRHGFDTGRWTSTAIEVVHGRAGFLDGIEARRARARIFINLTPDDAAHTASPDHSPTVVPPTTVVGFSDVRLGHRESGADRRQIIIRRRATRAMTYRRRTGLVRETVFRA